MSDDLESVIATYKTVPQLEDALVALSGSDFPLEQISVITKSLVGARRVHAFATSGFRTLSDEGVGLNGVFSTLIGAAFVWLPPAAQFVVVGPLAAALLEGMDEPQITATYHPLTPLVGWGVPEDRIAPFERLIQQGDSLLVLRGSQEQVAKVTWLLRCTEGAAVQACGLPVQSVSGVGLEPKPSHLTSHQT